MPLPERQLGVPEGWIAADGDGGACGFGRSSLSRKIRRTGESSVNLAYLWRNSVRRIVEVMVHATHCNARFCGQPRDCCPPRDHDDLTGIQAHYGITYVVGASRYFTWPSWGEGGWGRRKVDRDTARVERRAGMSGENLTMSYYPSSVRHRIHTAAESIEHILLRVVYRSDFHVMSASGVGRIFKDHTILKGLVLPQQYCGFQVLYYDHFLRAAG